MYNIVVLDFAGQDYNKAWHRIQRNNRSWMFLWLPVGLFDLFFFVTVSIWILLIIVYRLSRHRSDVVPFPVAAIFGSI